MEYNDKQIQIITVAEKLFADNSFDGTSVRDIAKEADVNVAMISYYFGSKEKLLEAIFDYRGGYVRLQLENVLNDEKASPLSKVYGLIDMYVEKMFNSQCFHKLMSSEQKFQTDPELRKHIFETKKKNATLIRKLIEEGQKKGEFSKKIDIPLMMTTMVGTANQLINTQQYYKEISNLQSLSEEEFQKHLKKKLSNHLKQLFKAVLTHENK